MGHGAELLPLFFLPKTIAATENVRLPPLTSVQVHHNLYERILFVTKHPITLRSIVERSRWLITKDGSIY
jgi:hypothetical protein